MSWDEATAWADNLSYAGYNDWRLPQTLPVNGINYNMSWSNDGSTDHGYGVTSLGSEMAYLYYVELKNLGYFDPSTNTNPGNIQPGWGFTNTGPFVNLPSNDGIVHWSSNLFIETRAWFFIF